MKMDYQERLAQERERFDAEVCVHDLPEIFHYWSNKYLRPLINSFGYDNIEDFFATEIAAMSGTVGRKIRIASVGCGDCSPEIQIAKRLVDKGVNDFHISCIDISPGALERGLQQIRESDLESRLSPVVHDFNAGLPPGEFDVVVANQSLHHVVELEVLFDSIRSRIANGGCLLVSDMIGRNGHQRWPEAKALVDEIWPWLPPSYRFNRQLQRQEDEFLDWDCSAEGFEGIRAQDVLPLMLERFQPSVFIAWGNIIDVFIDRGFGHSFHGRTAWDLHFIDRVHELDSAAIAAGHIKPTHLLGRFQSESNACIHVPGLGPADAVRRTA
ncbi:hypothetical protein GCM10008101_26640 [Lysobacter xinjiangensis]|uniref:Methyltransferase type 12 domain-containing protein n=1 Tax=Cognatilysobacter xinjiangensis TaxID=546892 RepID=A0ABQ3CAY7_9GAMM|nr:class I SAM-dependent methyltransferase [Lysobacter xinjiangensis]GGZ70948.1 hypothetical protein GCM10008101_26640 [Lysobacter xinjiangensis]